MARTPKVRLVLLVSPSIAQRYMALAERFRFSRNEVCRYALDPWLCGDRRMVQEDGGDLYR